ncbi:hypothetical protein NP493_8502g00002 [Ridgeia piscesae]|uniref:Fucolectin tachylectin-4 pentraxin-1 domain-containing protein n=1 Tax=Ridgeia piscesae TaxID=27915 RepID=A0AAD9MNF5_RIDPI|nr:hypothetical protein NP493_8502g00002 [Ridgeia piscesae]
MLASSLTFISSTLNIALHKKAYQSSLDGEAVAERAVDGRLKGFPGGRSCASTDHLPVRPWWTVDLGAVQTVVQLHISNWIECCPQRLHDFTVGLTNTLPTNTSGPQDSAHVVCLVYNGVFPARGTLTCTNLVRGRYLFIQINGDLVKNETLTLCEVEVYLTPNIALNKTAFQSTTEYSAPAERVVDGNTLNDFMGNSCANTGTKKTPPWWAVDLGSHQKVTHVQISYRLDTKGK